MTNKFQVDEMLPVSCGLFVIVKVDDQLYARSDDIISNIACWYLVDDAGLQGVQDIQQVEELERLFKHYMSIAEQQVDNGTNIALQNVLGIMARPEGTMH